MNRIAASVALAGIASVATLAHGQTYTFGGTPTDIPDGNPDGVTISTAPVVATSTIERVTCTITMNPGHPYVSDLKFTLTFTPADGTEPVSAILANENGDSYQMRGTYSFSDDATRRFGTPGQGGVLPPGTYLAMDGETQVSLNAAFAGLPASGTWSIQAVDALTLDSGTIESATVTVVRAGASSPPSGLSNSLRLVRGTPGTASPYSTVLTANIFAGQSPAAPIASVRADLSSLGLANATALFDDGTNGDVTAGDGVYSRAITPAASVAPGRYSIPLSVTDSANRTGSFSSLIEIIDVAVADFGTLTFDGSPASLSVGAGNGVPAWFTFTTNQAVIDPTNFVDITVTESAPFIDTRMALFSADGTLVKQNDDAGPDFLSQLSFGRVGAARPQVNEGTAPAGQDGPLTPGQYFLAVSDFSAGFVSPFGVTLLAALPSTATVQLTAGGQTALAVASTTPVINRGGPRAVSGPYYATVTGRIVPPTGGYVLQADFSSLGGGSSEPMFDNGTNGDAVAGDGIFTARYEVSAVDAGRYTVSVSAAGAEFFTASTEIRVSTIEVFDLGVLALSGSPVTVETPVPTRQVNWVRFELPQDVAAGGTLYLDINTNGSVLADGGGLDTHIGLFNGDGTFLGIFDDDSGVGSRSALSFGATDPTGRDTNGDGEINNGNNGGLASGVYYLALNFFSGQEYSSPFVATNTNVTTGGNYVVNVYAGVVGAPVGCLADVNGDGTAADGSDFILFINSFAIGDATVDSLADVAGGGDPTRPEGGPDGNIDGTDFIAFINAFAAGC